MFAAVRPILILFAALLALCTGLIGGVHALARQGSPPARVAALLPDDDCAAPCWQGLRPGYVDPDAMAAWLDDPPGAWVARDASDELGEVPNVVENWRIWLDQTAAAPADSLVLTTLRVHSPLLDEIQLAQAALALGELVEALGPPPYLDFYLDYDRPGIEQVAFRLYYPEQRLIAEGVLPISRPVLLPETHLTRLRYPAHPWGRPALAFDWRGLGHVRRYYPAWE